MSDIKRNPTLTFGGGPLLADYVGDFVLSIEVPDDIAREYRIQVDPPGGWPFQEFWLPSEVANKYRHTLVVLDGDGEVVRPDLVGK